jgi:hypothetical protein
LTRAWKRLEELFDAEHAEHSASPERLTETLVEAMRAKREAEDAIAQRRRQLAQRRWS